MKLPHRHVPKHVALNPVARAVAWNTLKNFAVDAKIKMYFMDEAQECEAWAMPLARYLTTVLVAVEYDRRQDDPEFHDRYILVAMAQKAVVAISQRKWGFMRDHLMTFEKGLDAAGELVKMVTPYAINHAWKATH